MKSNLTYSGKNSPSKFFLLATLYLIFVIVLNYFMPLSKMVFVGLIFFPLFVISFLLNVSFTVFIAILLTNGIQLILTKNFVVTHFTFFIPIFVIYLIKHNKNIFSLRKNFLFIPFILYLLSYVVTFVFTEYKPDSLYWHLIGIQFLIVYFFFIHYIDSKKKIIVMATILALSFILPLLTGLVQVMQNDGRINCNVFNANECAGYMTMFVFLFLTIIFCTKNTIIKYIATTGCVISVYLLMNTYSRGGQLGILLALLVYAMLKMTKMSKKQAVIVFISFSFLSIAVIYFSRGFFSRFSELSADNVDVSTLDRLGLWYSALRLFLDSPIYGIGVNNFQYYYLQYHPLYGIIPINRLLVAHNIMLNTIAEQGIIGLVALIAMHYAILKKIIWLLKNITSSFYREVIISLSAFFVFILVHNSLDTYWTSFGHVTSHFVLALFLALITVIERLSKNEANNTLN